MTTLSRLGKNKRALSNIIAYVLLISITISLSVMVYGWLKFHVAGDNVKECSDNVNIIIANYKCNNSNISNQGGALTITLKNKGLFKVDGYILRINDEDNAKFGFYTIDDKGVSISPGGEHTETFYFNETISGHKINTVTLAEVQPFIEDNGKVICKSYISQKIKCS